MFCLAFSFELVIFLPSAVHSSFVSFILSVCLQLQPLNVYFVFVLRCLQWGPTFCFLLLSLWDFPFILYSPGTFVFILCSTKLFSWTGGFIFAALRFCFFVFRYKFTHLFVVLNSQKMGVISRKIFPVCESMCVCCPALRSSSRQPVKRYKKLLSEIFPKSLVSILLLLCYVFSSFERIVSDSVI